MIVGAGGTGTVGCDLVGGLSALTWSRDAGGLPVGEADHAVCAVDERLVAGGTGASGRDVVGRLVGGGRAPRMLARGRDRARGLLAARCVGDFGGAVRVVAGGTGTSGREMGRLASGEVCVRAATGGRSS